MPVLLACHGEVRAQEPYQSSRHHYIWPECVLFARSCHARGEHNKERYWLYSAIHLMSPGQYEHVGSLLRLAEYYENDEGRIRKAGRILLIALTEAESAKPTRSDNTLNSKIDAWKAWAAYLRRRGEGAEAKKADLRAAQWHQKMMEHLMRLDRQLREGK